MRILPRIRRRWALVAAGTAAVLLVGAGATAAFAAGTTPTASTTASSSTCAPGVARLLRELPAGLTTDLQHLRKDTAANKPADRAAIKKKALAGGYGTRIERVARIAAGDRAKFAAALPASLKADLKTLRKDPAGSDARKQEAATIWNKALGGTYGSNIESLAKTAQTKVKAHCAAAGS